MQASCRKCSVIFSPEKRKNSDMLNCDFICFFPINLIPPIFFLDFFFTKVANVHYFKEHFVSLITGNHHPLLHPAPLSSIIP